MLAHGTSRRSVLGAPVLLSTRFGVCYLTQEQAAAPQTKARGAPRSWPCSESRICGPSRAWKRVVCDRIHGNAEGTRCFPHRLHAVQGAELGINIGGAVWQVLPTYTEEEADRSNQHITADLL